MFGVLFYFVFVRLCFFWGGVGANFVSSVGSELCDVSLKSVENRLRLFKTLGVRALFHRLGVSH